MIESTFPILSLMIALPLLAGMGLSGIRGDRPAQYFALGAAIMEVVLTGLCLLVFDFDSSRVQLMERRSWIPELNINYVVGVDGLSVAFPFLTAWVNLAIIVSTWNQIRQRVHVHLAMLFLLESATIGVFCALDLILFLLFWELTLIPVFFLLSLYGIGPERRYAALKYTVLMLVGGASLLTGFLLLAMNHSEQLGLPLSGGLSFDYLTLLHVPIATEIKSLVFLLLLLGFAVKAPLFPFHTWLPTVALEGPVGLTAWLTGLKLGIYGILRIAIPLVPGAVHEYDGLLKTLGVTGLLYGGLIALGETHLRRMLAYSSISHVGGMLIGIASLTHQGVQGAVFQLMNLSVVSTGLFLLSGFIRHRLGTTDLSGLSGVTGLMPKLSALFLILGLSNIGLPGTGGFPAELLILVGAFKSHLGMGFAVLLGSVLSVGYFFNFYRQAFFGPPPVGYSAKGLDLRPRELLTAGSFVILTLVPGLMPGPFMAICNKAVAVWISRINNPPEGSSYAMTQPEAVPTRPTATYATDAPVSPDI